MFPAGKKCTKERKKNQQTKIHNKKDGNGDDVVRAFMYILMKMTSMVESMMTLSSTLACTKMRMIIIMLIMVLMKTMMST
jgi:hypothetical protein